METVKVHRVQKRTVVEEEVDEEPIMDSVNVSYITNSHSVSADSTVGMLIVNFLIRTRSPVTTNVVSYGPGEGFFSMYNSDLRHTLVEAGIVSHVVLARSGFENEADAIRAISALAEYLGSMRAGMPHEDQELLNSAHAYLALHKPVRAVRGRATVVPLRADQGVVRESIGSTVPVLRSAPAVIPLPAVRAVAASPVRRTMRRTVVEEESTTSEEEEEIVQTYATYPAATRRRAPRY